MYSIPQELLHARILVPLANHDSAFVSDPHGRVRREQAADNTLSPEEKKEGWVLLFDGKSLDGWQTSNQRPQGTGG